MSEGITLTFLALALIVAFVIIAWAALTFGRVDRSGQDKRIHLFFSGTLPAGLLIIYLIRRYLDPGYGTAALVVLLLLAV